MHARRFACFFLGLWLAGGLLVALTATSNLRRVDRLLSQPNPIATVRLHDLAGDARPLLRYQASEFNRWLIEFWEKIQLGCAFAFLVILLFWSHENKLVLGGVVLLLALTAIQHFVFNEEIVALGRNLDFAAAGDAPRDRAQLWIAQTAYSAVEAVKWCVMLLLTARLVFSRKRSGRSRDSRHELDRIDIRDHRRVNR